MLLSAVQHDNLSVWMKGHDWGWSNIKSDRSRRNQVIISSPLWRGLSSRDTQPLLAWGLQQTDITRQISPDRYHRTDITRQISPYRHHRTDITQKTLPNRHHRTDIKRQTSHIFLHVLTSSYMCWYRLKIVQPLVVLKCSKMRSWEVLSSNLWSISVISALGSVTQYFITL